LIEECRSKNDVDVFWEGLEAEGFKEWAYGFDEGWRWRREKSMEI
jgi:hypothetical protein